MNNLVSYNLFEMSKISDKDILHRIIDFYEYLIEHIEIDLTNIAKKLGTEFKDIRCGYFIEIDNVRSIYGSSNLEKFRNDLLNANGFDDVDDLEININFKFPFPYNNSKKNSFFNFAQQRYGESKKISFYEDFILYQIDSASSSDVIKYKYNYKDLDNGRFYKEVLSNIEKWIIEKIEQKVIYTTNE